MLWCCCEGGGGGPDPLQCLYNPSTVQASHWGVDEFIPLGSWSTSNLSISRRLIGGNPYMTHFVVLYLGVIDNPSVVSAEHTEIELINDVEDVITYRIYGIDEDNWTGPTATTYQYFLDLPRTGSFVEFSVSSGDPTTFNRTHDGLKDIIVEIQGRPGWSEGNGMGFIYEYQLTGSTVPTTGFNSVTPNGNPSHPLYPVPNLQMYGGRCIDEP